VTSHRRQRRGRVDAAAAALGRRSHDLTIEKTTTPRLVSWRLSDAETPTGLVHVNFIEFPFEMPQVLLREIQGVDRFPA
jgi:hypothetical protein